MKSNSNSHFILIVGPCFYAIDRCMYMFLFSNISIPFLGVSNSPENLGGESLGSA